MYVDITCGSVVRGHPELGDDARRRCAAQGGDDTIRLKLILYYDEVEICNPLGYAAGKHKLGLFYFALVDLPPNLRMALHNIQLATVCLDKDFSYYGATQIICGPPGEPSHKGTSIGAALERLNAGREMFMPDGGMSMEPRTFKAWAICLAADYPAAGGCHLAATVHSLHLTPPPLCEQGSALASPRASRPTAFAVGATSTRRTTARGGRPSPSCGLLQMPQPPPATYCATPFRTPWIKPSMQRFLKVTRRIFARRRV